jgi:hypothetical protein
VARHVILPPPRLLARHHYDFAFYGLAVRNVAKGYTKSLYRKLGAASRAEAVERGRELGLI